MPSNRFLDYVLSEVDKAVPAACSDINNGEAGFGQEIPYVLLPGKDEMVGQVQFGRDFIGADEIPDVAGFKGQFAVGRSYTAFSNTPSTLTLNPLNMLHELTTLSYATPSINAGQQNVR